MMDDGCCTRPGRSRRVGRAYSGVQQYDIHVEFYLHPNFGTPQKTQNSHTFARLPHDSLAHAAVVYN